MAGTELEPERAGSVRAVERALTIVNILAEQRVPMGVADIAGRMGLHGSTVHRLLGTLVGFGWLEQEPDTARYLLGPHLLGISASALASSALIHQARDYLTRLAELSGCNAYLSTLVGRKVTYLARTAGKLGPSIRAEFEPGVVSHPLHTMADGKLLLAHQSPHDQAQYLETEELRGYTPATITTRDALEAELKRIRESGHAIDHGERYVFQQGVAVPVWDRRGAVIAGLLCWGRIELDDEKEQWLSQEMGLLSDELTDSLKGN
jgi:DNA-binding IclR family transcriptional regulator